MNAVVVVGRFGSERGDHDLEAVLSRLTTDRAVEARGLFGSHADRPVSIDAPTQRIGTLRPALRVTTQQRVTRPIP